jgi:hypothetical protein
MHIHTVAGFAAIAGTVAALSLPSPARAVDESKSENIGAWQIDATFTGDKLDRCTISRELDNDVVAKFARTADDLTFTLESSKWELDKGQDYSVKMKLGSQSWDTEVEAEAKSVSIGIDESKFMSGLRNANGLDVVAAGATIHVPLDGSNAALARLEECVDKNARAVETNPFVAPARRP